MKIIFAGTPQFSVPTLQALLDANYEVIAVYTQPDRPAGRGQKLQASPVKQLAEQYQLPICQPPTLRNVDEQKILADWQADVMIVIAYGLIVPKVVLEIPPLGCINVHASLLPRWRGAAPIHRAILAGDNQTGITIMQMDEGLDTGAMLHKVSTSISATETTQSLHDRLAVLGAQALIETLKNLVLGKIIPQPQSDIDTCYAKKIEKIEAIIQWQQSAIEIDRQVRAFNPWPIAYTLLDEQPLRIWQTQPLTEITTATPGTIIQVNKNGIDIATGHGTLRLLRLQLPGGKCLPVQALLNAHAKWFEIGRQLGK